MSDDSPTVFISFTPQDEAAARRIASALVRAGIAVCCEPAGSGSVEDVRQRLAGCALFLPIISNNTQERSTGAFRQEWQQAGQRMAHMADDAAFLLPVVVDNTANRDARVPAVFQNRPWARLDVWSSPTTVVDRIRAMLEQRVSAAEAARTEAARQQAAAQAVRTWLRSWVKRLPPWVRRGKVVFVFTIVVLASGAILLVPDRETDSTPLSQSPPQSEPAPAPTQPPPRRAEPEHASLAGSGPTVNRAGLVSSPPAATSISELGNRDTIQNVEAVAAPSDWRDAASPENSISRGLSNAARENSADPVVRFSKSGRSLPSRRIMPRAVQPDQRAPTLEGADPIVSRTENSSGLAQETGYPAFAQGSFTLALHQVEESLQHEQSVEALVLKARIEAEGFGDLPAARQTVARFTREQLTQSLAAVCAAKVAWWSGDADAGVAVLAPLAGTWISNELHEGPVEVLLGKAHRLAGELEQAAAAWNIALRAVHARQQGSFHSEDWAVLEAQILAYLDRDDEALAALTGGAGSSKNVGEPWGRARVSAWAELGFFDEAMAELLNQFRERMAGWATLQDWLRYDPDLESLREHRVDESITAELRRNHQ